MNPSFQDLYFAAADPEELSQRAPDALKRLADTHRALLAACPEGEVRVNIADPDEAQGAGTHVVQIVHPDMPFLVDSVTMAVNRSGRTVHWIVHPLLRVQRDAKGRVAEII